MSDCQDCAVTKLCFNQLLDLLFGHQIDVGCRFIQENYLVLSQNGSADANELLFSRAQIFTVLGNFFFKSAFFKMLKSCLNKNLFDFFVFDFVLRIDVESECATEEGWILGDDGDLFSKLLQGYFLDILAVDGDHS